MDVIYDFETVGNNSMTAAPVCLAAFCFDRNRFVSNDPYQFKEIVSECFYEKLDFEKIIKNHNYILDKDSLKWWKGLPSDARKQLTPSSDDLDLNEFITSFEEYLKKYKPIKYSWTRGNSYDPIVLDVMLSKATIDNSVSNILKYWQVRDIRTWIMTKFGEDSNTRDDFVTDDFKDSFVKHLCTHDIAADLLRMQTIIRIENNLQ